jgi:hypothetical protein
MRGLASRFFLQHLGVETILQLCGGGVLQPCGGRRTAVAWPGCSIPSSIRASVAGCAGGSRNTLYAVRAVLVFWNGPVLVLTARTYGSEDLPVRFGAAGARWCGAGRQVAAVIGAEVVAAREGFSADETVGATRGLTSGSLALIAYPHPSSGDAGEGLVAVASALRSSLLLFSRPERRSLSLLLQWSAVSQLEFVVPQVLRCGGCSYPREWNRSSVCNGILTAGVCSLWLSRPEHLGILV